MFQEVRYEQDKQKDFAKQKIEKTTRKKPLQSVLINTFQHTTHWMHWLSRQWK